MKNKEEATTGRLFTPSKTGIRHNQKITSVATASAGGNVTWYKRCVTVSKNYHPAIPFLGMSQKN
jgi:hypothetical protein